MLTLELSKQIKDEIWDYCRANNITNIDEFTMKILKQGFTVEKFGATPQVVEKIVEVEVPVEKEVYVTDDSHVKDLSEKISKLEEERDSYKKDSEHFQKLWNDTLHKLELEQSKNKRDIYGE